MAEVTGAESIAVPTELTLQHVNEAIADDAECIAALHDKELTPELVKVLKASEFPFSLGLLPKTEANKAAWQAMAKGISALLEYDGDTSHWNDLASEYASIYLTGAYRASPYESVWTDEDHLTCQSAMFELREIYAQAGLIAANWRQRPDDHLVLQLLYIAHASRNSKSFDDWRDLAKFLDEHLLRWIPEFASRVASRSSSIFYCGLAVLTAAWLDTLRDLLSEILSEPRPTRSEIEERLRKSRPLKSIPESLPFLPGAEGPSW